MELEHQIREYLDQGESEKIKLIISQLCRDYAYAVHQPNARNGGLIGLAAAAIALGTNEVANYLEEIIHPVLACFGDQDARVRYYACESLYNIAKVAKGEILIYFNEIFDVLCKLSSDSDSSVKNGADLLDRLVKDIVSEKATSYISIIDRNNTPAQAVVKDNNGNYLQVNQKQDNKTAFQLQKFIPLLMERIYAINPNTRIFLVSWITLLDSVPDLELISYLPSFFGGLLSFLNDNHNDVRVITQSALDIFLHEIRRISEIQKLVEEKKKAEHQGENIITSTPKKGDDQDDTQATIPIENLTINTDKASNDNGEDPSDKHTDYDEDEIVEETGLDYIPGQDIHLDFAQIIEILISNLDSSEDKIQLVVINWLQNLLEISPDSFIYFLPKILSILLSIISGGANNNSNGGGNNNSSNLVENSSSINFNLNSSKELANSLNESLISFVNNLSEENNSKLNYSKIINTLFLKIYSENEITRIASLNWLKFINKKNPNKLLENIDETFKNLLKLLKDLNENVINLNLNLISDILKNLNDENFKIFIYNLLELFKNDLNFLEKRGDFIIKKLCLNLNSVFFFKNLSIVLADENEFDFNFKNLIIQILNKILITSSELITVRRLLKNTSNNDDNLQLFKILFKSWSFNSPSLLSLCLLSENYELAYKVLEIIVDFEINLNILIQFDILIQLLESTIFTKLRLQLLKPEKYPYLYKVLYGILMVVPQSNAFKILKNRLNSIGNLNSINLNLFIEKAGDHSDTKQWDELLDNFREIQSANNQAV